MKLDEYRSYLEAWLADPEHLGNIDTQVTPQAYPQPVALEWTQWDGIEMPDGKIVALRTTVYVAEHKRTSYASCAAFIQGNWKELTRIEFGKLAVVPAFSTRSIANMNDRDIEDGDLQAAFHQDVQQVRETAIYVLAMSHLPEPLADGGQLPLVEHGDEA